MSDFEDLENTPKTKPLVLVVEDDADFMDFLLSELEEHYQLLSATNGKEGLEVARQHLPDLVITDLMMPIMNGVELCDQIKSTPETSHLPVILLTAKDSVESQLAGLKNGADDYVTKPFVLELLFARISNLLESRKVLRERFSREVAMPGPLSMDHFPDQQFLQKAFDVLEEHAGDDSFSADSFAQKMNISVRTLHRKLKALTNETPSKLIWGVRLKKAADLLQRSELRITEVAFKVGFSESAHFSRMFRQHFEMSPSEYRNKHQLSS